jgi:hypothetical protein
MERPDPPLPKYYTVRLPNPDPSITRCHHHQIHNHLETLHSKVLISLTFKNERTYSYELPFVINHNLSVFTAIKIPDFLVTHFSQT